MTLGFANVSLKLRKICKITANILSQLWRPFARNSPILIATMDLQASIALAVGFQIPYIWYSMLTLFPETIPREGFKSIPAWRNPTSDAEREVCTFGLLISLAPSLVIPMSLWYIARVSKWCVMSLARLTVLNLEKLQFSPKTAHFKRNIVLHPLFSGDMLVSGGISPSNQLFC